MSTMTSLHPAATSSQIDQAISDLMAGSRQLVVLPIEKRIELTKACLPLVASAAREWVEQACRGKQIPPGSPAGKILATGWPAVPALVEVAGRRSLATPKRAWVLALLHSITGEHLPPLGALGESTVHSGGLRPFSGGGFSSSTVTHSGGEPCVDTQLEVVAAWQASLKEMDVRSK